MTGKTTTMLAVGDLILEEPQGERFFALAAPVLRSGDVVVGQGEVPFTSRGVSPFVNMFAPSIGGDPGNIGALHSAGFNVITLAGNHIWDCGAPGIEDTIAGLQKYGIAFVGAGMNLDEARRPAVIERNGTRFGFLSYNCAGPRGSWALLDKPGCAYVHIVTAYDEMGGTDPGEARIIYTFAEPRSLRAMVEDIQKLRPLCDVLVVVFHKGIAFVPGKLAMYDQQVSYAAIDAGADLVLGHHAHMLKGVEQYKGKFIFHGVGHFVPAMKRRTKERKMSTKLLGFDAVAKSRNTEGNLTIIAKCIVDKGRISRVSYLPCLINEQWQPEIAKNDERGRRVFDFMDKITREAGLNARYEWDGDEVVVHAD